MPRLQKQPPASRREEVTEPDSSVQIQGSTSPRKSAVSSTQRSQGNLDNGSAQIWPSNTVRVRRFQRDKTEDKANAWDLLMNFDLADLTSGKQKKMPPVIESHVKKAIQQYQSDLTDEDRDVDDISDNDEDDDEEEGEDSSQTQLQRSYSFDGSQDTVRPEAVSTEDDDTTHDDADFCCEISAKGKGIVYFCYACEITYCTKCWPKQAAHRKKGSGHQKVNVTIARIIKDTLDVDRTEEEQARLHLLDECTSWFGAIKDKEGAVFRDFGRFAALVADRNSDERKRCYPALVSFVGETGAGKSSLIKLLVSTLAAGTTSQTPVVGSAANSETPTSGDVHLYSDPHTIDTDRPLLYADCEGLHGGTLEPMGVKLRSRRPSVPVTTKPRTASFEKHLRRRYETDKREIIWAKTPERRTRRYFVENLYPRLLYTFSDVIVFVVKNARTIEDVVQQLITWADAVIETSSNQPVLPHAIIVLNASDNKDARLWDVDASTTSLLNSVKVAVNENPTLKKYAAKWGYRINSAQSLLLSYYSSIRVVRVPEKSQPTLIHQQLQKLYTEITKAAASSHSSKHSVRMKLNCEELQPYLQRAFDHFCGDLDEAFDFVKASFMNSGIPSDFSGNILKMAVNIMQVWENKINGPLLFRELSFIVASCVMLDASRQGKLGTAAQVFPEYLDHFDEALDDFCEKFWPCEFVTAGGRCVNVKAGHKKGHQSRKGVMLGAGDYWSSFTAQGHRDVFRNDIFARLEELLDCLALESKDVVVEQEAAAKVHRTLILGPFFQHWGGAGRFISHSACLACLVSPAEHSLPCGHVLCTSCLNAFGTARGPTLIEMRFCPLHDRETSHFRWPVTVIPANAGIRILTIDGGGVRGIVPLMVLKRLEQEFGLPIQSFFDLIIGTSTGGIIALGLGEKGWSVTDCITKFEQLAKTAFTKHRGLGWEVIDFLITAINNGKYKIEPLEALLRAEYGEDSLFGGDMKELKTSGSPSPSPCKVGVTTTTYSGRPCLLANYNRPELESTTTDSNLHTVNEDNEVTVPRYEEKSSPYDFLRAEQPRDEIRVWEAARATSAALKIFRPYTHALTRKTFIDGGIYFNNPIEIALREHKLVWPKNRPDAPDVLLSLGTGYAPGKRNQSVVLPARGPFSYFKQMRQIAVDHVKSSQNSQQQYHTTLERMRRDLRSRFTRFTLHLPKLPKPDDVSAIQYLKDEARNELSVRRLDIRALANRLLASSFYFEPISASTKKNDDGTVEMSGSIKCRIASHTPELNKLGELLRRRCQEAYNKPESASQHSPCFVIEEKSRGMEAQQVPLTDNVISGMIENSQFNLGHIKIIISSPNAMSDIHLRFGTEATQAANNSISGFPRFWDEEVTRPTKGRLSLSPSRQRQISRRKRPVWSAPDEKMLPVLSRYAQQKNPGLATDADLQAVEANLSKQTVLHITPSRSPGSAGSEEFQRHVHAAEIFGGHPDDWLKDLKIDPDGPPSYTDSRPLQQSTPVDSGIFEMPDHSTADWRLTEEELVRDPFPHLRPDHDPFYGPSVSPGPTQLQVPTQTVPLWSSSSHGSSRTGLSTSSHRSSQSMSTSGRAMRKFNTVMGHSGRNSTGSVRESTDMYGPG